MYTVHDYLYNKAPLMSCLAYVSSALHELNQSNHCMRAGQQRIGTPTPLQIMEGPKQWLLGLAADAVCVCFATLNFWGSNVVNHIYIYSLESLCFGCQLFTLLCGWCSFNFDLTILELQFGKDCPSQVSTNIFEPGCFSLRSKKAKISDSKPRSQLPHLTSGLQRWEAAAWG